MRPAENARATDTKMAKITDSAFAVLISCPREYIPSDLTILRIDMANVPPRRSNTIDTVVDVGIPKVLNTSRRITSVSIMPTQMAMISSK